MTNEIKTKQNTSYHIDKYTQNIIEITTCNDYVSTNTVHFTKWDEDEEEILKEFESKLR
jgi:tRNA A37 threonylcarbamoyladenosine biosynthesis protein TsaE